MIEWLLLLLPIAAASGWMAGKRSTESIKIENRSRLNAAYFSNLRYLLNEQPEKAIDSLLNTLEVDNEAIEPYLSLGNLFRHRGEIDRAIRIHQDLIDKSYLSQSQKRRVSLELGLDYMQAGMLDRAESLFLDIIKQESHTDIAIYQLLDIYQQKKDWYQAITIAQKLGEGSSEIIGTILAHFYCELAEQQYTQKRKTEAEKLIKQALISDWRCVRATLMQARLAIDDSNYRAAVHLLHQVEQQDPNYLSEILKPLLECYQHLGDADRFSYWLAEVLGRYPGYTPLVLARVKYLQQQGELREARQFLADQLRKQYSIEGLQYLLNLGMPKSIDSISELWKLMEEIVNDLLKAKSKYICGFCGFSGKYCHWQCPSCKRWGVIKPFTMSIRF
ncbi:tetratricopeptide repeat protein [Candidatus Nitrosoglobus terrae]|uniref:Lipopolysaccharide assembly protein B n=1 Tax=Candidatus Nitrosoglobus terrae TaxID=1630141 RepID=A0A1Q2SM79_9GAMM|nr:lipopolysaccharide assembly protein LapB [Candidatus Nitrosoglobus terrae]BAW80248.1 tetratricopeptide repeat protein [Candidatus Nitrosoglobus terrae]